MWCGNLCKKDESVLRIMSMPIVSVAMITYGQENYIKEAIHGVLMQQADFEIELIVADDRSPDNTEEVVKSIVASHTNGHWIKYTRHAENKGMMDNFIWALDQCRGKYIAICEGDDYWTDPVKLQKQVKVLEQHPECSFCFHQGIRINEVDSKYDVYPLDNQERFDATSFFQMTTIPMASVVLRSHLSRIFVRHHSHPDFQLLCSLVTQGDAYFIREPMSVYRVHPGGISYNHSAFHYVKRRVNELYEEASSKHFSIDVRKQIARLYIESVFILFQNYKKELSAKDRLLYIYRAVCLRKPTRNYFPDYLKLFGFLLN
jgi:glycosyltransferase involved in cell wall biosynthesis